jgi:hypothetical protein
LAWPGKRGVAGLKGERGERGPKGDPGERGQAAPAILSWLLDREHYTAMPLMSDGTEGPPLNLRPLFEQYHGETQRGS